MAKSKSKNKSVITYRVSDGNVVEVQDGREMGIVYDCLEPGEAEDICMLLNQGINADWDTLGPVLKELQRSRMAKSKSKPESPVPTPKSKSAARKPPPKPRPRVLRADLAVEELPETTGFGMAMKVAHGNDPWGNPYVASVSMQGQDLHILRAGLPIRRVLLADLIAAALRAEEVS